MGPAGRPGAARRPHGPAVGRGLPRAPASSTAPSRQDRPVDGRRQRWPAGQARHAHRQGRLRQARRPRPAARSWSAPRSPTSKDERPLGPQSGPERQMTPMTMSRMLPPGASPIPMVTLHDSLLSSSARKLPIRQAARPERPPAALPGPQLLGRQGPGGAELLPLPGGGIRHPADARRRDEPGRDQGAVRGRVPAAEDHARRAAAVPGHAAPQRAGDRRRAAARDSSSSSAAASAAARSCSAPWPTSSASASRASTPSGSSTGSIPRSAGSSPARPWSLCMLLVLSALDAGDGAVRTSSASRLPAFHEFFNFDQRPAGSRSRWGSPRSCTSSATG